MALRPLLQVEPEDAAALLGGGLVAVDLSQMQRYRPEGAPSVRSLISSGRLVYSAIDPQEQWQTYEQILRRLRTEPGPVDADCEDLASLVAAEYRYTGEDPGATVYVYKTGPRLSHVVVKRSSGQLEDPSIAAGMGAHLSGVAPW